MVMSKFNVVTYIKPTNDFDMFATSLANIQKSQYLDKFCMTLYGDNYIWCFYVKTISICL